MKQAEEKSYPNNFLIICPSWTNWQSIKNKIKTSINYPCQKFLYQTIPLKVYNASTKLLFSSKKQVHESMSL